MFKISINVLLNQKNLNLDFNNVIVWVKSNHAYNKKIIIYLFNVINES